MVDIGGVVVDKRQYIIEIARLHARRALVMAGFNLTPESLNEKMLCDLLVNEVAEILETVHFRIAPPLRVFRFWVHDGDVLEQQKKVVSLAENYCFRLAEKVASLHALPDGRIDWDVSQNARGAANIFVAVTKSFLPNYITELLVAARADAGGTDSSEDVAEDRIWSVWPFAPSRRS